MDNNLPFRKRYDIQAKRNEPKSRWSDWAIADNYDDAVKHMCRAAELGYCSRIIDRGERANE